MSSSIGCENFYSGSGNLSLDGWTCGNTVFVGMFNRIYEMCVDLRSVVLPFRSEGRVGLCDGR